MRDVMIGQSDYSVVVGIFGTDGAPETGLAYTDIDIDYARVETDNDVTTTDVSPASLASLTAAHSDWGWYEIGQGLYRLDIADAVFAAGAWESVVTVSDASGTDFQPVHIGFRLVDPPATLASGNILRISKSGIAAWHYPSADTDAARGTALIAAQTAAAAGDTIFVSSHCLCTSALGKDGVTYYLSNGAIISNATTAVVAAASAMEFSVIGDGVLSGSANSTPTVSLTHASAIVNVQCRDVLASGSGSAGLKTTAGVLNAAITEDIRSTQYDGIWNAGGTINATASRIVGGDDGIELGGGHTNVRCREIVAGSNGTPVFGTGAAGTTYTIYADRAYKSSYVTNNAVTINEGHKGFIEIGYVVGAVEWNGGDVILANSVIDSSALSAPTVVMQGADGKFAFHNVTLVTKSTETYSIYTEITEFQQAIELSGAVNMNKAVHADVDVYYSAIDWSRISNKTTTQNLSGTTIKDASDVPTAAENAAAVAAQADIAAGLTNIADVKTLQQARNR